MITDEDMFEAYYNCFKHKKSKRSAIEYSIYHQKDIIALVEEINNRTYTVSKSTVFVVTKPKYREVFCANMRDRIVHHYVCMRLEPLFERIFSDRVFNCRKGKGVMYGVNMLSADIKECSNNYTEDCYIMKCDLKGFFMSIDKELLCKKLLNFIRENYQGNDVEDILWLTELITMNEPECNCEKHGDLSLWEYIPANKSLFTNGKGFGLPIGNLPSQLNANFLLHSFDDYVQNTLGFKFYGRYVDDFYIIDKCKNKLLNSMPFMRLFLSDNLNITLHPNKFYIQHYSKGVTFTGSIVKYDRIYPAKRTIGNLYNSISRLNCSSNLQELEANVRSINSYLGFLIHDNSYNIRYKAMHMIDKNLFEYIYIKGHYQSIQIKKKYKDAETGDLRNVF